MTTLSAPATRWCTFRLGDACFAVEAAVVVEVLRGGSLAVVPRAPKGVLGLVHLRGRIVPVLDPAGPVGVPSVAPTGTRLVIAVGDDWYGLVVDEMLDVIEIPPERVERCAGADAAGTPLAGTFAADAGLVHLLDPVRMIHSLVRHPAPLPERLGGSDDGDR